MAYTIDSATKRIILDSANVTVKSVYAAWVDWVALSDNAKYLPAFSAVGGDDLGGGLSIPPYYFLTNGWRVRPMEANQVLTVTGNLFVEGGGDPIVATLGTFNVLVKLVVPVMAQGISTGGGSAPTAEQVAAAVGALTVEGAITLLQALRLANSANAGKTDGFVPGTAGFGAIRDIADSKDRVVAQYDVNGNRVAIALDLT